jgi:hypothetical protein
MVENGQLKAGGTIDAFCRLFNALATKPHFLSMTFDTANWLRAGEDPQDASREADRRGLSHSRKSTPCNLLLTS